MSQRCALRRRGFATALLLAFAACDEPRPALGDETAAELRALRLVLQQQAARPATTDRTAIDAAMSPLRDALQGMLASQQQLEQRQLALTQELQRWSQLLIVSSNDQRAEEGKALATRLQALEQSLLAQDARHREVENLMAGALDRTAERLEAFLKQLQALPAANPSPEPAAQPPAGTPPGPTNGTAPPDGRLVPDHAATRSDPEAAPARVDHGDVMRRPWRWAWGGLGGLGLLAGVLFFRRWQRGEMPAPRSARQAAAQVQPAAGERAPSPEPGEAALPAAGEPGVAEIWAAAALLGEAVGRLRQSPATATPTTPEPPVPVDPADATPPARGPANAVGLDALDDLFVIEDDAPASPAPPTPLAAPTPSAPEFVRYRVPALGERARLAVQSRLQTDPRILRRPAPSVRPVDGGFEIAFALVPSLSPGERCQLEQSVRDDC